jgi:hypothetical protein
MKNLILIIVLTYLGNAHAQNYLNHTSTWKELSASCGFDGTCWYVDYLITLPGDTVINGTNYYKAKSEGTITTWDLDGDTIVSIVTFSPPHQFIREEQRKFYRYHTSAGYDILLADFNLMVGDTAVDDQCSDAEIVDHIDTLYLGNIPRKRFHFNPNGSFGTTLIEGVGSTKGLFSHPCQEIGIESGTAMLCYSQDGNTMQIDSSADCSQTVSVSPSNPYSLIVDHYPNPVVNTLYLTIPSTNNKKHIIHLYDLQGNLHYSHSLRESQLSIDMSSLPAGIYILVINDSRSVVSKKVIKTK